MLRVKYLKSNPSLSFKIEQSHRVKHESNKKEKAAMTF
jgi:hypothetical protein